MTSRVEELQRMCDNINENGGLDSGEWHTALLAQIAQNLAVIADVMMADRKTEPQTDCTEALTLLWIKNMVTDEEFYRIDARLKCISCKWWNDTIVGGSECVSKECTYQPKGEPNCSEKPNNCEHITEDGVTCAKYPACDDCPGNPLNKVKGSERLVKGSEQTDCQTCKWWSSYGYCVHRKCKGYEPQTDCPWK